MKNSIILSIFALLFAFGCSKDAPPAPSGATAPAKTDAPAAAPASKTEPTPTFVLAVSEYPSWSAFLAAAEMGLINKEPGEMGPIEKEWKVDIDLRLAQYETCLTMIGAETADAVAATNMDALIPAEKSPFVVILPTSTSAGADALIVPKTITTVQQLKGKKVYMLAKSVSEYMFRRNLELLGENPADYEVSNKDPEASATAFQQHKSGYDAIVVWNPFVLDTLEARTDSHALFTSTTIPNEIIDAIVASEKALAKPGGDRFAKAVIHLFYALNQKLRNPVTHNDVLMAIGEKFSNITDPAKMEAIVTQTKFFGTSAEGLAVLEDPSLNTTMQTANRVYRALDIIKDDVRVTVSTEPAAAAGLRFDTSYMKAVAAKTGL